MSSWNLIIDVARCENCNNCVLANKDEYVGNDFSGYSAPRQLHGTGGIRIHRQVRGEGHMVDAAYLPTMCNHCDDAPCIKAAGPGVIGKRADGIVIIDPVKAKGRKDLVGACPYGAIEWNEEQQLPQQWIFDAHLLDQGWAEPRCAHVCPTEAIKALKVEDAQMARMASEQQLRVLKPELGAKPRVYYKNLHRFDQCFIGGSVVARSAGVLDCVHDARVALLKDGRELQQARTDAFGDFKFDKLEPGSGNYTLSIGHDSFGTARIDAQLASQSLVLGEIELQRIAARA
jgi:Fe-S-cluster-containing dehydrogenase component